MRPIKFRAWDKIRKKMWLPEPYRHAIHLDFQTGIVEIGNGGDVIFLQFTGLKDKNGKEIYEGDVVQWHSTNGAAVAEVKYNTKKQTLTPYITSSTEIIGNIHENPELLN